LLQDSVKSAALTIAQNVVAIYQKDGTSIPGQVPEPYYWWLGGAMFDTLIRYWKFTGISKYNDMIAQGLLFQVGDNLNFMPANQTKSEVSYRNSMVYCLLLTIS